jgi:hypothetical protein
MLGSTCVEVLFVPMFFAVMMGWSGKDKEQREGVPAPENAGG